MQQSNIGRIYTNYYFDYFYYQHNFQNSENRVECPSRLEISDSNLANVSSGQNLCWFY